MLALSTPLAHVVIATTTPWPRRSTACARPRSFTRVGPWAYWIKWSSSLRNGSIAAAHGDNRKQRRALDGRPFEYVRLNGSFHQLTVTWLAQHPTVPDDRATAQDRRRGPASDFPALPRAVVRDVEVGS